MKAIIRQKLSTFLGSKLFFRLILGFFVFQAVWIALSAVYPQAFDEDFHFGIIKIYAQHWLPFIANHPPATSPYGAVAQDPSFLYHYLMSFPYRFVALFIHNETGQVLVLRLINVAFFGVGLVLFRRVFLRVSNSAALSNLCLFIVSLLPVSPLLAGQINYDNLLLPSAAIAYLLTFRVIDQIKKHTLSLPRLLILITTCLAVTMIKYEFLPILFAIGVFLVGFALHSLRGTWQSAWKNMFRDWSKLSLSKRLLILAVFVGVVGLFVSRDGVNIIRYHDVVPDCAQILKPSDCSAYSVWIHDFTAHVAVVNGQTHPNSTIRTYVGDWFYWMWYRLFFVISGPTREFANYPPLVLPAAAFIVLTAGAVMALCGYGRRLFSQPYTLFLGITIVIYGVILISLGYLKYQATDVLELMNGRYLLPVLIPALILAAMAVNHFLRRIRYARESLALLVVVCFLQGGGLLTYISRSDPNWHWDNTAVQTVNTKAQKTLRPVLIEGTRTYQTEKWFFNGKDS